ncbi:hypothetical protein G6F60_015766 [Rhizopus arrhizus]|nr:hypothetical protein G6F60_015766 [Rhizopus arrhizus]
MGAPADGAAAPGGRHGGTQRWPGRAAMSGADGGACAGTTKRPVRCRRHQRRRLRAAGARPRRSCRRG